MCLCMRRRVVNSAGAQRIDIDLYRSCVPLANISNLIDQNPMRNDEQWKQQRKLMARRSRDCNCGSFCTHRQT